MPAGLRITYTHAPKSPGFWYPCRRKEAEDVLRAHHEYWGREQVPVDGEMVTRPVPAESVVATYCQSFTEKDGEAVLEKPEVLDAVTILK